MRVIAGSAKRIGLVAPLGVTTRPTSDMAKENLFNIIAAQIVGATFLDLFCGSGAIGLEALSRGASNAILVDNSKTAIAAVKQNIAKTKLPATILEMAVEDALNSFRLSNIKFDIIFLDPPYGESLAVKTLEMIVTSDILATGGTIILENDIELTAPSTLELTDIRKYGRTFFMFFE